jgi:glycerol kinase
MSASSTRCHIIRAALESIAYQIRDALVTMQQDSGVTVTRLHVDGGATQNRFLMQFLADVTGVELLISRNADCSSLGAAMAGAKGLGIYSSLADVAAMARDAERVQPTMPRDAADALCAGWQRAIGQVLAGVA